MGTAPRARRIRMLMLATPGISSAIPMNRRVEKTAAGIYREVSRRLSNCHVTLHTPVSTQHCGSLSTAMAEPDSLVKT